MTFFEQNKDINSGQNYVIVRSYLAGVFAGYVTEQELKESRTSRTILITKARRIYEWEGAATLSQLAQEGTSNPNECKFPCEVDAVILYEVIEVLKTTEKGQNSIASVPVWRS